MNNSEEDIGFGARLAQAREAAGMTQAEAAAAVGLSQGTISEAERVGKGSSHVVKFAELYNVSAEWLSHGKLPMTVPVSAGVQPAWPFELVDEGRFHALSERQKGFVEGAVLAVIEALEARAIAAPATTTARTGAAKSRKAKTAV